MTQHLIKSEQDMVQVTHGVSKEISKLSLSNYSLVAQIIILNFFTAVIGLIFLLLFNYFLITNNKNIANKTDQINFSIDNITHYLQNNAIIRVPQFNEENCNRSINSENKNDNNIDCGKIILSDPQLDPTSSQNHLFDKYLDQSNNIRVYDVNLIKYADTESLYISSDVIEVDIKQIYNNLNILDIYKKKYLDLFNNIQRFFDSKKLQQYVDHYRGDISIVIETVKKQKQISQINKIEKDELLLTKSSPIISNNNVYGVVLISGNLIQDNVESALISFNVSNLFLIIIFFMFLFSIFFSKSIVGPIKSLSKIVKNEQDKLAKHNNNINYPVRNDEIGTLSKEIENMSKNLKIHINELENFAADVSHELKNPLASLKSSNELLIDNKIDSEKKYLLLQNINKDIERMNTLISDISNYTRTQIEIDEELFEEFNLTELIHELIESFSNNKTSVKIIFEFEKNPIIVRANRKKLAQVFINIIDNSISFSPLNSEILIRQFTKKKLVIILIADQGKGIKSKLKNRIFDRFYTDRLENSEYHSGLGLSISKRILENFSGSLNLYESHLKDYKGACFQIKLPL